MLNIEVYFIWCFFPQMLQRDFLKAGCLSHNFTDSRQWTLMGKKNMCVYIHTHTHTHARTHTHTHSLFQHPKALLKSQIHLFSSVTGQRLFPSGAPCSDMRWERQEHITELSSRGQLLPFQEGNWVCVWVLISWHQMYSAVSLSILPRLINSPCSKSNQHLKHSTKCLHFYA